MLVNPTIEKLVRLKLTGMRQALEEQFQLPEVVELSFEDRLGLLIDREITERENRRLKRRLSVAKLRQQACMEDIDYRHRRGLDKSLMVELTSCEWITQSKNILIIGPTGVGKTYLACALANKACRNGLDAQYIRLPKFLYELKIARADGSYLKRLAQLSKMDLLVLDDWGLNTLSDEQRRDLLEVLEERYANSSTLIASQIPTEHWHELIGDPTIADAILDRLVHNAYKVILEGESMRKHRAMTTKNKEATQI